MKGPNPAGQRSPWLCLLRPFVAQRPAAHVVLLGDQRDVPVQLRQRQLDERHAAHRDRWGERASDGPSAVVA
jgi:hypothetical protein